MSQSTTAPVTLEVVYPENLGRLHLLLKLFLGWLYVGIPHGIILYVYGILAWITTFIAFIAILITGRYPLVLFNFSVGYQRWSARVNAYWVYFMVDSYPPFSNDAPDHPLALEIEYPETLSRGKAVLKVLLGWLYAGIPRGIALAIYFIAVLVVLFISWWSILIFGKFPQGFFDFVVGFVRWGTRLNAYLYLLRDEYPPFNGRA
ncbi:MAG: hypothetical protein BZY88_19305 [SAR202 cluster bacterium Io17-Chloro-G9]|nr:MAG: hypothetical protein BZY88_19305 [SAR202 cluster bacterium Io17-Chloro-G9]